MIKNYIVKEHEANTTLGTIEPEDLLKFLNQCISVVKGLQSYEEEVKEILKSYEEQVANTLAQSALPLDSALSDDDIDELLEIMESAEIQNYDAISLFYASFYSTWDSLNVHVRTTVFLIKEFNKLVNKHADAWICPSLEDLKTTINYATTIIKNLLFIAYYEFDMGSVNVQEADGRFYIDEIYDKYCKHYGLDPEECTKIIGDLKSIYKIKLSIFDEHPELEEPFEELMGPNLINVDDDKITLEIVKDVIEGKLTDQQAYEMIKDDSAEIGGDGGTNPLAQELTGTEMAKLHLF